MSQYTPQTNASSSQNNASSFDMDFALPQMQSFDFDRLDPIALEQTLAYLRDNPEPRSEDIEGFSYQGMLAGVVAEGDWLEGVMEVTQQEMGDQSSCQNANSARCTRCTVLGSDGAASGKLLQCTWDECETQMSSPKELAAHLEIHTSHASALWKPSSTCTWQGCSSKAVFKTSASYNIHLKNIHTDPLVCTTPGCSYKKPFRNEQDRERHNVTAHSKALKFICPYDSCEAEIRSFARKDKWLKHIRETEHQNDAFCPFYHCALEQGATKGGFNTRTETSKHFSVHHPGNREDGYQCALGSCGKYSSPHCWKREGLQNHLQRHHGINETYWMMGNCHRTGSEIFSIEHFTSSNPGYSWRNYIGPWHDCTICAPPAESHLDYSSNEYPAV